MKMEAVFSFETSVDFQQTALRSTPPQKIVLFKIRNELKSKNLKLVQIFHHVVEISDSRSK
jgi:hypothetical protein